MQNVLRGNPQDVGVLANGLRFSRAATELVGLANSPSTFRDAPPVMRRDSGVGWKCGLGRRDVSHYFLEVAIQQCQPPTAGVHY